MVLLPVLLMLMASAAPAVSTTGACAKHASRRYGEVYPTPAGHRLRAGTVAYGAVVSEATCREQCAVTPACKQAVQASSAGQRDENVPPCPTRHRCSAVGVAIASCFPYAL